MSRPHNPHRLYPDFFARIRANCSIDEDDPNGCWLWTGHVGTNHRPQMGLRIDGKRCTCNVARKVIEQFFLPGAWEASHTCGDETWLCVRPGHIIPETKKQNMARRWGKPIPEGIDWPLQPGPVPVWLPPKIEFDAPGLVSIECPF